MDARQLRFFLAVIDYEGFSKAAEQLYIAQPSLSQAIAGLERDLGVALFHRVGRGVKPTDAGLNLIGPARQVLRDLASAQSAMDAVKGITTGRVEIITMPSPGVEPLTHDHPAVRNRSSGYHLECGRRVHSRRGAARSPDRCL